MSSSRINFYELKPFYCFEIGFRSYFVNAPCVDRQSTTRQFCFYFILRLRTQAIKSRGSSVVKLSKRGVNKKETFWELIGI